MENLFEVDLNTVEDADGDCVDLARITFGEDGVMGDDGEVEYGSQWIIFTVNDDIADRPI